MKQTKLWLATIAMLLYSLTANSETLKFDDWKSTNTALNSTSSKTYSFTITEDCILSFDWLTRCGSDYLSVTLDGSVIAKMSMANEGTIVQYINKGTHTLELSFHLNDATSNYYPEYASVSNIAVTDLTDGIAYAIIDNTANVIGAVDATEIAIPESVTIDGNVYSVTSIGASAFKNLKSLTSIIIPESVVSIGKSSFYGCSSLASITLPSSLTSLEEDFFSGCSNLTTITIPANVTSIGNNAFSGCDNLAEIIFEDGSKTLKLGHYLSTEYGLFYDCRLTTVYLGRNLSYGPSPFYIVNDNSVIKNVIIGDSVTSIGGGLFKGSDFESITIPKNVTLIGDNAFYGCKGLRKIINYSNLPLSVGASDYGYIAYYAQQVINMKEITTVNDFQFYNSNGVNYLANYIGEESEITLPDNHNGEKYKIDNCAFFNSYHITSVTIPANVTSIGNNAFAGCINLIEIIFEDGSETLELGYNSYSSSSYTNGHGLFFSCPLEKVYWGRNLSYNTGRSYGYSPFYNKSTLTSVTIGRNITSIGESALRDCSRLMTIIIPENVTSIKNHAFGGCTNLAEIIFEDGNETLTLGYNPDFIAKQLFAYCALKEVYLGRNLSYNTGSTYGYSPFYNHKGLKYVSVGGQVSIGEYTFYNCSNLCSVTIGNGVLSIGSNAFSTPKKVIWLTNTPPTGYANAKGSINYVANDQYTSLSNTKVYPYLSSMFEVEAVKYVPVSPSERTCHAIDCVYDDAAATINVGETASFKGVAMKVTEVMPYTFYGNDQIKEVSVSHLGNIGGYAFYGCDGMETAAIENDGLIGDQAFSGCSSLKTVTLGDSIGSLGDKAFYQCSNLQEIVIPDSVKSVGAYCFSSCSAMKSAVIGDGLTNIAQYTFQNCTGLTNVMVGDGVTTINNYAFQNCSSLPEITLPQAVTKVGDYVFAGCSKLADVVIADRTTALALGSNGSSPLFADCLLDSVYIGGKITYSTANSEGYSPFYRNTSLRTVVITDREEQIYNNEFYGCTNLKNVTIGNGVKSIGDYAFSGCSSLDKFAFGSSMQRIGEEAFSDCTNLTEICSSAMNPPTCGTQALDDINKWNCTLKVPIGYQSAYMAADQWKEFFFIEDVVDGVGQLIYDNSEQPMVIYDLMGRKVKDTDKIKGGIYIVNGKKVVIE